MTANNGWPGKPGVPLNPEKDGWHWLLANTNKGPQPEAAFWDSRCFAWFCQGNEELTRPEKMMNYGWLGYLGPVLTPDEATALQARADRNAAGFARVDAEAERDKFLHKQEIAALQKRVVGLDKALSELLKTFDGVGFRIGKTHPPHAADDEEAEQYYATNYKGETALFMFQEWRRWKLVHEARAALGGKDE